MANTDLKILRLGPWTEGLLPDVGEVNLSNNALVEAENVVYDIEGSVIKRKGYSTWSTNDPSGMSYGRWLFGFEEASFEDHLFYVDKDNDLWHVDLSVGTTFARANAGGNLTMGDSSEKGGASLNDVMYLTSRGNNGKVVQFDGTNFANISDNNLNGGGTEFPLAKYLLTKHSRMFAANIDDSGTGVHNSRLWWSKPDDANTWNSNAWIDFDAENGSPITGLAQVGDRIVIFKQDGFYVLAGATNNTFTVFQISSTTGMGPGSSSVEHEGKLYWIDPRTEGIYVFDGASFERIDNGISDYIFDNLGRPSSNGAVSYRLHTWRDKIYFGVTQLDANDFVTHTFVYDTRLKVWSEFSYGVQDTVMADSVLYGLSPSSGSTPPKGVVKLHTGNNDAGSTIAIKVTVPWFAPNEDFTTESKIRKIIPYLHGVIDPNDVTFKLFADWDPDNNVGSVKNDLTTSTKLYTAEELVGIDVGPRRSWKIKMVADHNKALVLDRMDIIMSRRDRQQGDQR